jgi:hypothetical protein
MYITHARVRAWTQSTQLVASLTSSVSFGATPRAARNQVHLQVRYVLLWQRSLDPATSQPSSSQNCHSCSSLAVSTYQYQYHIGPVTNPHPPLAHYHTPFPNNGSHLHPYRPPLEPLTLAATWPNQEASCIFNCSPSAPLASIYPST